MVTFFKDDLCSESTMEYVISKSQAGDMKTVLNNPWVPFSVNECTTLEPALEMEIKPPAGDSLKLEFTSTWGVTCSEYGSFLLYVFGKDIKECLAESDADKRPIPHTSASTDTKARAYWTLTGKSSFCYKAAEYHGDGTPDNQYYKTDCNPNNASVAGIILGSVALALSLAAVGLAAMAMGKKGGGGGAPPAKPAEPAVPQEGGAQGSTTAAAAVGAATDA